MNDQALLIISIMTEKWFRKFLFIFNLTGVYYHLIMSSFIEDKNFFSHFHNIKFVNLCFDKICKTLKNL